MRGPGLTRRLAALPAGRVEYWYAEVSTWHTTHRNGVEVFHFGNGQTEAHHPAPDSYKEARRPSHGIPMTVLEVLGSMSSKGKRKT